MPNTTVRTADPTPNSPVHCAITVQVREGKEQVFDERLVLFLQKSLRCPGMTGVHLIRPAPGTDSHEYGILRSFESEAASRQFYESDLFQSYKRETEELVIGEAEMRPLHGLEAFFRGSGSTPPRWKMAIVTWVAVFPAVLFWNWLVGSRLIMLPSLVTTGIVVALVVVTLTWFVMPRLTNLLSSWLQE